MFTKAIVFDHRRRTPAGKEGPVEIRFTYNRKHYYINTSIKVRGRELRDGVIINRMDADTLNRQLRMVMVRAERAVLACIEHNQSINVAAIKRQIYNIDDANDENNKTLLDWLNEQIVMLNVKEGTRRHYEIMAKRLYQFGKLRRWSDLSVERIYEWDAWLHTLTRAQSNGDKQAQREPLRISQGTVHNYHRDLNALLSRAVRFGIIDQNPYSVLTGEFPKGEYESVEYLTEEEISAIESLHPMTGTQVAMARDLFVFQMYTGLSYSDAQAFDINDYKKTKVPDKDGKKTERWVHIGERIKTGVPYVSRLLPPAVEVLERYGFQVPNIGNTQYNLSLKVIQQALGIRTKLHSHLARHTFATRMLAMGAKLENVSKMLGHTKITQTQRYAKVLAESVHEDYDKMEEKLKNR